jgi:DNA replication and repair protein RecF
MLSPDLAVTRLTLTDFRNYRALRLENHAPMLVLTGPNGAGKTNLLEAISLLMPGRGLRGAALSELARIGGAGGWAVAANISDVETEVSLGTAYAADPENEPVNGARDVVIDGEKVPAADLADHFRCIWLVPAMDRLFAGPGGDRRRFLDRLVQAFDPSHGTRVAAFEKLMRDRNIVLADTMPDSAWLNGLESQMAEAGTAIAAGRRTAIESLRHRMVLARTASSFPWSTIAVEGEIEAFLETMPAVKAEDEYRRILVDSRPLDRAAGRTLRGPHRSDFLVVHGPTATKAALCSTGQQKALLIGLLLAHASSVKEARGAAPVLLLDEVAAHLDAARREALFATLTRLGSQVWMTGTDETLFRALGSDAEFLHVEAGIVTASARN